MQYTNSCIPYHFIVVSQYNKHQPNRLQVYIDLQYSTVASICTIRYCATNQDNFESFCGYSSCFRIQRKRVKCFPSTLPWRHWKTQPSPVVLNLMFEENSDRKSNDGLSWLHCLRKVPCSKCFPFSRKQMPAFSMSFGLKSIFEKFRFRDGLAWTIGCITVEIKFSGVVRTPAAWQSNPAISNPQGNDERLEITRDRDSRG